MQRHPAYTNGFSTYKRDDDEVFSIDPHRFTPRSRHPRSQLQRRLVYGGVLFTLAVLFFLFPSTRNLLPNIGDVKPSYHSFEIETLRYYDLSDMGGTARGWEREERVLLCTPLRDAEPHLPMFFSHLRNFTYPHHLIDLAFLVSDSKDRTEELLTQLLEDLQADPDPKQPFGEISVIHKDFGQKVNQDVESRHGFAAQASRRKLMAQARNWLLSAALRPTHSWVYWRDADVETAPFTILEDLMRHNKDVIVPNVWRPLPDWLGGEQPYDLNSWQESETALALADTLDEDAVIVEGYAEYATWRPHLAYLRDPYGDPDMEMEIDGVGGVSILAKARVFRSGVHFPAFSFEKHAETEGFGKMAKRMHYSVVGLPHYTVWHLYEPSVDDIRHMEEMEAERKAREQEEKDRVDRLKRIKEEFKDPNSQWEKDKADMAAANTESEEKDPLDKAAAAVAAAGAAVGGHPLLKDEEEALTNQAIKQNQEQGKKGRPAGAADAVEKPHLVKISEEETVEEPLLDKAVDTAAGVAGKAKEVAGTVVDKAAQAIKDEEEPAGAAARGGGENMV